MLRLRRTAARHRQGPGSARGFREHPCVALGVRWTTRLPHPPGPSAKSFLRAIEPSHRVVGTDAHDGPVTCWSEASGGRRATGAKSRPGEDPAAGELAGVQSADAKDLPEAIRLYRDGWSLARLAAKFDVSPSTANKTLRNAGVVPPAAGAQASVPVARSEHPHTRSSTGVDAAGASICARGRCSSEREPEREPRLRMVDGGDSSLEQLIA